MRNYFHVLSNLLERSSPPLRRLSFTSKGLAPVLGQALIRLLGATPLLTNLSMKFVMTSDIFDRLCPTAIPDGDAPRVPDFLPELRVLHIACDTGYKSLVKIIPSRLDPRSHSSALLSDFRFKWGSPNPAHNTTDWRKLDVIDDEVISSLKDVKRRGISIAVVDQRGKDFLQDEGV
ncbi:unnamed protein product [Cyclocybe aegerita]|uniref:Uncharacterized protein n=1 Tax=Cyclocybe aegerita TaxID=1973307 RepID=A0A8S0VRX2_CYCAE|nr:unnamed protein product [Cyclocybe aegerita]